MQCKIWEPLPGCSIPACLALPDTEVIRRPSSDSRPEEETAAHIVHGATMHENVLNGVLIISDKPFATRCTHMPQTQHRKSHGARTQHCKQTGPSVQYGTRLQEAHAGHRHTSTAAHRGKIPVQGTKVWKRGSPCLDKPVLPCGKHHRTHVAGTNQPYPAKHDNTKQQASIHPRTQEHMELQLHQHFATHIDRSCSLHKDTNHMLYWVGTAKMRVPKNTQKCGNTGSPCLDNPVSGQLGKGT